MFFLSDAINGKNGWEDYKKNLFNKGLERGLVVQLFVEIIKTR